jgi:glyoxylase-like metal-dependent hydrolase (beta-lactamase superfamily II)
METRSGIKALRLELSDSFVVHAALLWDEKDVILVDTGVPGKLEVIRQALEREAVPLEKLTKIIITHQDSDHIGGLPELVEACEGRVEVLAHEFIKPYLLGELPLIKSGAFVPPTKVDRFLQDGEVLPYCGGIQIIFTPGHTPDHISLYHHPSKTLISGDALTSQEGVLMTPAPKHTPDWGTALKSVAKLLDLEIETVITYHGGIVEDRIKERLAEIADGK